MADTFLIPKGGQTQDTTPTLIFRVDRLPWARGMFLRVTRNGTVIAATSSPTVNFDAAYAPTLDFSGVTSSGLAITWNYTPYSVSSRYQLSFVDGPLTPALYTYGLQWATALSGGNVLASSTTYAITIVP